MSRGRLIRPAHPVLLALLCCALPGGEPVLGIRPGEFSWATRIDFLPAGRGEGLKPWSDDQSRSALLTLELAVQGRASVLGFSRFKLDDCATEHGEALEPAILTPEGIPHGGRRTVADAALPLLQLSLSQARRTHRRLARLAGSVSVTLGQGEARTWRLSLDGLELRKEHEIPDLAGGNLALVERDEEHLVFRAGRSTPGAVVEALLVDAGGRPVPVRGNRVETPEDGVRFIVLLRKAPAPGSALQLRYHPGAITSDLRFDLREVDLGLDLVGRSMLKGAGTRGAEDF